MAISDGVSAFSRCARQRHSSAFFCSRWKPRPHCSGDELTSQYPLDALRTNDLKVVVLILGISSPITHSSGTHSMNPFTGPFAHTVP